MIMKQIFITLYLHIVTWMRLCFFGEITNIRATRLVENNERKSINFKRTLQVVIFCKNTRIVYDTLDMWICTIDLING